MPCYKCGKTFDEPTEICLKCGMHLLSNGVKCSDYKECINDEKDKQCEGCEKCITYPGCGYTCTLIEPPMVGDNYNYPACYCACVYSELATLKNKANPDKPSPYYCTCYACCPIYNMIYYTRLSPLINSDGVLCKPDPGYKCHLPPLIPFRYDRTYEELLRLDRSYNRSEPNAKSAFHKRLEKKAKRERDDKYYEHKNAVDAKTREILYANTKNIDTNTYRPARDSTQERRAPNAIDFGVLRSK